MLEISLSGSGEGPGWVTAPGYSTVGSWLASASGYERYANPLRGHPRGGPHSGRRDDCREGRVEKQGKPG